MGKSVSINQTYFNEFKQEFVTIKSTTEANKLLGDFVLMYLSSKGVNAEIMYEYEIPISPQSTTHMYTLIGGKKKKYTTNTNQKTRKVDFAIKIPNNPITLWELDDKTHFLPLNSDNKKQNAINFDQIALKERKQIDDALNKTVEENRFLQLIRIQLYDSKTKERFTINQKSKNIIKAIDIHILNQTNDWIWENIFFESDVDDALFLTNPAFIKKYGYSYFDPLIPQEIKDRDLRMLYDDIQYHNNIAKYSCLDFLPRTLISHRDVNPVIFHNIVNKEFNNQIPLYNVMVGPCIDKEKAFTWLFKNEKSKYPNVIAPLMFDDYQKTVKAFLNKNHMVLMPENLNPLQSTDSSLCIPYNTWNKQTILDYVKSNYWKHENRVYKY